VRTGTEPNGHLVDDEHTNPATTTVATPKEQPMTDDTNILPTDTDDTEGHAAKFRPAPAVAESDDTEGHIARPGRVQPAAGEGEDTEGHAAKGRP
jgi:hypothetical protein